MIENGLRDVGNYLLEGSGRTELRYVGCPQKAQAEAGVFGGGGKYSKLWESFRRKTNNICFAGEEKSQSPLDVRICSDCWGCADSFGFQEKGGEGSVQMGVG